MTKTGQESAPRPAGSGRAGGDARPMLMLVVATVGFAVNFWAWARWDESRSGY
ncbi:hypothetical protein [Actinomadura spongiicola]|uniref:hypothetical protein n=1 Tax=Actinomadura spongiicola TaxID=2303421 RepID=UPI00267CC399